MTTTSEKELFAKMYRFSAEIRWLHWLRALLIITMIGTGFYLAKPFLTPGPALEPINFQNALVRFWHVIFGFGLAFVVIMRIFLYYFDEHSSRYERASTRDTISPAAWGQQIKYYLMLGEVKHRGAYGPLQHLTYIILMALLLLQILTGFILHASNYHDGLGGGAGQTAGAAFRLAGRAERGQQPPLSDHVGPDYLYPHPYLHGLLERQPSPGPRHRADGQRLQLR